MPLYEYECEKCGHRFEKIQKFSDPPLDTCRSAAGPSTSCSRSPAFQFKGTGWYVTDYAKSGKTGTEGNESATPSRPNPIRLEIDPQPRSSTTATQQLRRQPTDEDRQTRRSGEFALQRVSRYSTNGSARSGRFIAKYTIAFR